MSATLLAALASNALGWGLPVEEASTFAFRCPEMTATDGEHASCLLYSNGDLECEGYWEPTIYTSYGDPTPPAGDYTSVHGGYRSFAALRSNGVAVVWDPYATDTLSGEYTTIDYDGRMFCGVATDGSLHCEEPGVPQPDCSALFSEDTRCTPGGNDYVDVAVDWGHACALKSSGEIECWGKDAPWVSGTWTAVSAGDDFSCGVDTWGSITCWGDPARPGVPSLPPGGWTQLESWWDSTCAVATDGTTTCWNNYGTQSTLADTYLSVNDGCGITTDHRMVCFDWWNAWELEMEVSGDCLQAEASDPVFGF